MRKRWKIFCGLLVGYILIYVILSLNGEYHWNYRQSSFREFRWAPFGFYKINPQSEESGKWNKAMIYMFFPFFAVDVIYVHKDEPDTRE